MVKQNQGFRIDLNLEENTNDTQALSNLGGVGIANDLRIIQNNLRNLSSIPFNNIRDGFFVFDVDKVIPINSIVSTASTTGNSTELEVSLASSYNIYSPNIVVISGVTGSASTVYNGEFVTTVTTDGGTVHKIEIPDLKYTASASGSDVSGATITFKPKNDFIFTDGDVVNVTKNVNTGSSNLVTSQDYYVCNSDTLTKFQLSTTPPSVGLSPVTVTTTIISNQVSDSKSIPGSYEYTLPSNSSNISIKIASGGGGSGGADACGSGAPVLGGVGGRGRYAEFTLPDGTSGTLLFSVGGGGSNGLNSGQTNFAGGLGGGFGGGLGGDDRPGGSSGGGGGGGGYTSVSLDNTTIAVAGGGAGGGGGSLCNYSGPVNSPYAYGGGDGGAFSSTTSTIPISTDWDGGHGDGGASLGGDGGGVGGGGGGAPGGSAGEFAGNDQQGGAAQANRAYGGLGGSSVYRSDYLTLSSESTYTESSDGYLEISYTYTTIATSTSTPQTIIVGTTVTVDSVNDSTFLFVRQDKVTQENLLNYIEPEIQDTEEFGGYLSDSINGIFESTQANLETADYFVKQKYKGTDDTSAVRDIKFEGNIKIDDPGSTNYNYSQLSNDKSPGIFINGVRAFSSDNNPWTKDGTTLKTLSEEVTMGELFFGDNITITGINVDSLSQTDVTTFTHKVPIQINEETYYLLLRL